MTPDIKSVKHRPPRLVCKAGHVLAEHGYPVGNGQGATFIRCRICHTARAKAYKIERKRMTGEMNANG